MNTATIRPALSVPSSPARCVARYTGEPALLAALVTGIAFAIASGAAPLDNWQSWLLTQVGFSFTNTNPVLCLIHGALYYLPVLAAGIGLLPSVLLLVSGALALAWLVTVTVEVPSIRFLRRWTPTGNKSARPEYQS